MGAERQGGDTPSWGAALDGVERQVERASLFAHTALGESAERLTEVESFVYGLVDVLVATELVDREVLSEAVASVRSQLEEHGATASAGVTLRVDGPDADEVVEVDCAARMHVCHAVCCRLRFALSAAEVEAGTARWDLGRPYEIRHDPTGTCVHNDRADHGCGIYADRPTVCRRYSCAGDQRIWSDFDRMELNTAWIDENLGATAPRLARASMVWLDAPGIGR